MKSFRSRKEKFWANSEVRGVMTLLSILIRPTLMRPPVVKA
jgi:hypothetical protein